ncbi:hypothetical protein DM02DRAFT_608053 [Periconia macrospinosa]|uniref:Uncharacterized protein n=1 Tax=Periconia macrospinosa TaxID=97972 RepID=A0A2V1EES2_9PLEO|nr:hypothetical protein DM02DRAFT_608053 [Periconia macrospinosa]
MYHLSRHPLVARRLTINISYLSLSTAWRKRTLFPDSRQQTTRNFSDNDRKTFQRPENINMPAPFQDQRAIELLSEHIAESFNAIDYSQSADSIATMPAISLDDVHATIRKLNEDIRLLDVQLGVGGGSLATSVEERFAEMNDLGDSAEAKSRRARKELDVIVEGLCDQALRPGAPWGFVVFRTVYGPQSDAPFARIINELRDIEEWLSDYDQPYLWPRYELTVIEDENTLQGADSHTVRNAFRSWVANDLTPRFKHPENWGGTAKIHEMLRSDTPANNPSWDKKLGTHHPAVGLPTRWQFCLFVDETCLRSVDLSSPRSPCVKLLTTDWEGDRAVTVAEGWEDGETDDVFEDVGWMYMDVDDFVVRYRDLMDPCEWNEVYLRPQKGDVP